MMPSLAEMEAVLVVARHGGFRAAARDLDAGDGQHNAANREIPATVQRHEARTLVAEKEPGRQNAGAQHEQPRFCERGQVFMLLIHRGFQNDTAMQPAMRPNDRPRV